MKNRGVKFSKVHCATFTPYTFLSFSSHRVFFAYFLQRYDCIADNHRTFACGCDIRSRVRGGFYRSGSQTSQWLFDERRFGQILCLLQEPPGETEKTVG